MKRVLLIFNAKAGKAKSKSVLFDVVETLCGSDFLVTTAITTHAGHATELARGASDYDMVVVCGGDGTLNEVVQGMVEMETSIPIGYIPAGSTNDFATSLELEGDPRKAIKSIVDGSPQSIDIGMFHHRYFTYIASFGAFTQTSYNTPQTVKNVLGHPAYVLEGIKELPNLQTYHVRAVTETEEYEGDYVFGSVSNTTSMAGMVHFSTEFVDMNDGLLEVLLVKRPKNIAELNRILLGIIYSDFSGDMFEFFKTASVTIESDGSFPWSLDGEKQDGMKSVTIRNIPNAIHIVK